jgi:hypothetical protein
MRPAEDRLQRLRQPVERARDHAAAAGRRWSTPWLGETTPSLTPIVSAMLSDVSLGSSSRMTCSLAEPFGPEVQHVRIAAVRPRRRG